MHVNQHNMPAINFVGARSQNLRAWKLSTKSSPRQYCFCRDAKEPSHIGKRRIKIIICINLFCDPESWQTSPETKELFLLISRAILINFCLHINNKKDRLRVVPFSLNPSSVKTKYKWGKKKWLRETLWKDFFLALLFSYHVQQSKRKRYRSYFTVSPNTTMHKTANEDAACISVPHGRVINFSRVFLILKIIRLVVHATMCVS